jgi:hypothetical protein
MEVTGWGSLPGVWGGTFKTNSVGSVDIGLQKSFMKRKANLRVNVSDIFFTSPWNGRSNYGGINVYANGYWESRAVRVSFDYRFGSDKVKAARNRKMASDDLQNRAK